MKYRLANVWQTRKETFSEASSGSLLVQSTNSHWLQLFQKSESADTNKKSNVKSVQTGRPLLWDG